MNVRIAAGKTPRPILESPAADPTRSQGRRRDASGDVSNTDVQQDRFTPSPIQGPINAEKVGYSRSPGVRLPAAQDDGRREGQNPSQPELTEEEKKEVEKLKERDREVKTHEQSHAQALGPYKRGGPKYDYETGPDSRQYAVGGSVDVDLSEEDSPEATAQKMATIARASLAVAEPSSQDRAVAQEARAKAQEAQKEAARQGTSRTVAPNGEQDAGGSQPTSAGVDLFA